MAVGIKLICNKRMEWQRSDGMILSAILFCFILLLCFLAFFSGFFVGLRKKQKETPKTSPTLLTEEQKQYIEKAQRELVNFWAYDGTKQGEK